MKPGASELDTCVKQEMIEVSRSGTLSSSCTYKCENPPEFYFKTEDSTTAYLESDSGYNEKTGVIRSEDTVGFLKLDVVPVKNEPEDGKTFQCDICPNPIVSSLCSESSDRLGDIKHLERSHNGRKIFKCHVCDHSFS